MSYQRDTSFKLSRIFSDPFALSTVSIASVGWIIAFCGSISSALTLSTFPVFAWWGIACEFFIIIGVFYVFASNSIDAYRLAILAYLATATVYTTNSTNNFVYLTTPSTAAAAAGYILLSIINIIWIFYFGTTDETKFHSLLDPYSDHNAVSSRQMNNMGNQSSPFERMSGAASNSATATGSAAQRHNSQQGLPSSNFSRTNSASYPQMFMAAPLGGFENSSDATPKDATFRQSHASIGTSEVPATPTEYPYRARAVYTYNANPSDANEISFEKGEILEVSDISGKWWQAKRANGQVGICPSNYVVLQD